MTHGEQMAALIANLHPCKEAIDWLVQQKNQEQAWKNCERGDWMIWLICSQIKSPPWSDDRKQLLACCLDVAEIAKHLWPKDQAGKIENAIGVLRTWIDTKATIEEARQAKSDLNAATYAANAAYAAANAAYAAANAAYAASCAADAAANAADAATYAANAARTETLSRAADIVRQHFSNPPTITR